MRWLVAACGGLSLIAGQAQEASPDLDFLEYLGTWQESDEDWLAVAEWEPEPAPEGRRETGTEDDADE